MKPFLTLIALTAAVIGSANAEEGYRRYFNLRHEYTVEYPIGFIPHQEVGSVDGLVFSSPEKDAELLVWTRACIENQDDTPEHFIATAKSAEKKGTQTLTYQTKGKNFAVVSGYRQDQVFYDKLIIDGGDCTMLEVSYAKLHRDKYDAMVSHIAASFKTK